MRDLQPFAGLGAADGLRRESNIGTKCKEWDMADTVSRSNDKHS
jgi:hypothetical protein